MTRVLCLCLVAFSLLNGNAQTWFQSGVPNGRDVNGIHIFGRDTVLAVGGWMLADSTQSVFKTYNGGLLWDVNIDTNQLWLKSVEFSDRQNGIAVGAGGRILKSSDAGVQWTQVSSPVNRDFNKVFFIDPMNVIVAGGKQADSAQTEKQTILKSTDGGQSWSVKHDQNGAWLNSVHLFNSTTGFAVGDNGTILKTTNTGNTWTSVASPIQRDFNSIWFTDANTGFIVGGNLSNDSIRTILKTTNGGNSWTIIKDELGGWLTDVHFIDQNIGYAVGDRATILKTTDGGQNWIQEILNGASGDERFNAVRFLNNDYGWVVGKDGVEFIYTVATVPEPYAAGVELVDSTQAWVNGIINTHGEPARLSVIYTADTSWATADATFPGDVKSNGYSSTRVLISGLAPNTTYYYMIYAFTLAGTALTDTFSFFTGNAGGKVETQAAAAVTNNSATLNGTVAGFPAAVNLSFEFGNTPAFGNQIAASPPVVNDTQMQAVSANLASLQPDTLYFFRLKGVSNSQAYYGSSMAFFTGQAYSSLEADYATDVTDSAATLNGWASGFKVPASISFELSIDSQAFYPVPNAASYSINDTLTHSVSTAALYLAQNTKYFFRMKAELISGIYYSNPFYFITGQGDLRVQTFTATDVTRTSAQLNGRVHDFSEPVSLSFQYGATTSLGNELSATPAQVNDTASHEAHAPISGLQSGTLYYYRLKAETGNGTEFFGGIKQVYVGEPSIPNWDFQLWDNDTVELPYRWFVATDSFERVPGHSGNFAIKLNSQNLLLLGKFKDKDTTGHGPRIYGGMPFNARPDSVIAWFNFDNLPNDSSVNMMIFLTRQDSLIALQNCYLQGSTGGDFQRKAFKIDYLSPLAPDTLSIAVLFEQPGKSLSIDDISFTSAAPAVVNGDFETWFSYPHQSLQSWSYLKYIVFDSVPGPALNMVKMAYFNQQEDDYAAEVQTVDMDGQGNYTNGSINASSGIIGTPKPSFPVYARHQTLNGYFQYYPVNGDSMLIDVRLTRNGQEIGKGVFTYGDSATQFEKFSAPIIYFDPSVPDSGIITIACSQGYAYGPSRLIIDKLSFDGFAGNMEETGIEEQDGAQPGFVVFPNPASASVTVKLQNFSKGIVEIFDLQGKLLISHILSADQISIDIKNLRAGIYLVRIRSKEKTDVTKIIVLN